MLDPQITKRADRAVQDIGAMTEPSDPAYRGPVAVAARQTMSAQRREGSLITAALDAVYAASGRYVVLKNLHVPIGRAVRLMVAAQGDAFGKPMPRCKSGRGIRVDLAVLDTWTAAVYFIEVKRGAHTIGHDHLQRLLENARALDLIGLNVGQHHFHRPVRSARCLLLSYYGQTAVPPAMKLTAETLDGFFGLSLTESVDAHLAYFRFRLSQRVPLLMGYKRSSKSARPSVPA